jgi:hypothetical protein
MTMQTPSRALARGTARSAVDWKCRRIRRSGWCGNDRASDPARCDWVSQREREREAARGARASACARPISSTAAPHRPPGSHLPDDGGAAAGIALGVWAGGERFETDCCGLPGTAPLSRNLGRRRWRQPVATTGSAGRLRQRVAPGGSASQQCRPAAPTAGGTDGRRRRCDHRLHLRRRLPCSAAGPDEPTLRLRPGYITEVAISAPDVYTTLEDVVTHPPP